MLLYHGSNIEIFNIDLEKCRKYKDFGQGFYLTTLKEQAEQMAIRTVGKFGGTPVVTIYEIDLEQLKTLNVKIFDSVSKDWALMIINNRNSNFQNFLDPLSNHDNKYDVVIGPVANDDISRIFSLYVEGIIKIEQLSTVLMYKKLNNQYSFHTKKAIDMLLKVDAVKI